MNYKNYTATISPSDRFPGMTHVQCSYNGGSISRNFETVEQALEFARNFEIPYQPSWSEVTMNGQYGAH